MAAESPSTTAIRDEVADALPLREGSAALVSEVSLDQEPLPRVIRRTVLYVLAVVVAALVTVWSVSRLSGFLYTVAFGFFLGLVMEPAVNRLERRGWRRGAGTGLVLGSIVAGTTLFLVVFGNALVTQLGELIAALPELVATAVAWVNDQTGSTLSLQDVLESLAVTSTDLTDAAAVVGGGLVDLIGGAVRLLVNGSMMLLFAFYFAADGPRLRRGVGTWFPPRRQQVIVTVWDIATARAGTYVVSRGILAVISSAAHGVFFVLIGLPYWLPLALWVGFVSQFIPTIGTYLAGLLPIVVALTSGEPAIAVAILVFVTLYQQVENLLLSPRVTQETMQVHAAIAFGAVIVGGTLFGAAGALLAIPVVAVVQAVVDTYGHRYALVPELAPVDVPVAQKQTGDRHRVWRSLPSRPTASRSRRRSQRV